MLRKLYKHEFYSLFRSLYPIYAALCLFALLCKLPMYLDIDNIIFETVTGFSVIFYIISILATFVVGMVIIITRFYKNLLSHEGYLTFSLPFTATQHIVCKLICAAVMMILNGLAVILSLIIVGLGTETFNEIIDIFSLMLKDFFANETAFTVTLFVLQVIVMIIASVVQSVLMFYSAMAIGQQFKSKIGGSVIAYIAIYVATEIFATVTVLPFMLGFGENFEDWLISKGVGAIQLFLLYPIVLSLIISTVYFLITRHFLSKKLNLE